MNDQQSASGKWKLTVVLLTPIVVAALATLMFVTGIGIPDGTRNKGELILPPQPWQQLDIRTAEGSWQEAQQFGMWRIVQVTDDGCGQVCLDSLHLTRQVHIRLGKESHRVARELISTGAVLSSETTQLLDSEHQSLARWQGDANQVRDLVGEMAEGDYFIVDPQGYAMMRFRANQPGEELLKDLMFLLTKKTGGM